MKQIINTKPAYLYLLSLFFVLHGFTENYDYIPLKDASLLLLIYLTASLLISSALWLFYKDFSKSNLISFLFMNFYFFFGYIYDNLQRFSPNHFISRYSTIIIGSLSFILFIFILLFFLKKKLSRVNSFFNIFLILLLLVDVVWLSIKVVTNKKFGDTVFKNQFFVCDTCQKPDIYFIVPDLYAGDQALKETMAFDNSDFTEQLKRRNFHYISESRSNYNFTPFSIASILQMDFLTHLKGSNTNHEDLSTCYNAIRRNGTTRILLQHGYQLENLSLFDIYNQPAPIKKTILPEKTKFITAQTLLYRLKNDVRLNLGQFFRSEKRRHLFLVKNNNEKLFRETINISKTKSNKPRFVYTHLMMPHYPYYFNAGGSPNADSMLYDGTERNIPGYIGYLQYTNQKLLHLIDTIFSNSAKPPIILVASDHGFREFPGKEDKKYFFMNFCAIYLPSGNYSHFYPGMSNVNLFRALFNTQFNQKFSLLKDSTIYIEP